MRIERALLIILSTTCTTLTAQAQNNECPSGDPSNCHPVFEACGEGAAHALRLTGTPEEGTAIISNDPATLHLMLELPMGWFFSRIRIHAGPGEAPADPGAYPHRFEYPAARNAVSINLPMFAECGRVSISADVVQLTMFGDVRARGQATLVGTPIAGSSAESVGYCTGCRRCCAGPGAFRTHGVAAWAAAAGGHPAAAYRDARFAQAFPGGLWVGGLSAVHLTTSAAVREVMSAGGPPRQLHQSYVDPTREALRNALVAHLAALGLNLGFDAADPQYSASAFPLGELVIVDGPYAGMTARAFGDWVATRLGTNDGVALSAQQLTDLVGTLVRLNEDFADGVEAGGALACPTP